MGMGESKCKGNLDYSLWGGTAWVSSAVTAPKARSSTPSKMFTVLTFNIWFSKTDQDKRFSYILSMFEDLFPDVICLQEVTNSFLLKLQQDKWVKEHYFVSDINGKSTNLLKNGYGELVLTKLLPSRFDCIEFPTMMGRKLIAVEFQLDGEPFTVGCVHLESLNTKKVRKSQLEICQKVFSSSPNAILCGDFNFCSYRNFNFNDKDLENDGLTSTMSDYDDVWLLLNDPKTHPGFTFDSEINQNIFQNEQMRYDRVMLRSQTWHAESIRLVGNEPIEKGGKVFPSDHFGLLTTLVRKK
eukprot:Lithocolla_globosa_v1_NODE_6931_length_1013_cov_199.186848.p1 type:complete len:298 gc:universal NODE_6931_length_1013_cov_199.186848:961-68(-)